MNFLRTQLEDPKRLARVKRWSVAILVLIVIAEITLPMFSHSEHAHHFWFDNIPAWGSLYGLISCVAIIVVSKFLGNVWLMRREDYYDS